MRKLIAVILTVAAYAACDIPVEYGEYAPVRAIVIHANPMKISVGTESDGVRRSTQGGDWQTWSGCSGGLDNTHIRSLLRDPATPYKLLAGTYGGGVFTTIGVGCDWVPFNPFQTTAIVNALALDPYQPGTFYAGLGSGQGLHGAYVSVNYGDWTPILQNVDVLAVAVAAGGPKLILAGTDGQGLKLTLNGGTTWLPPKSGFPGNASVHSIAVDPTDPFKIFAGTFGGIYKSVTRGAHWTQVHPTPNDYVYALAIDPVSPNNVFAGTLDGVLKSTNGGNSNTWVPGGLTGEAVYALAIDPGNPDKVLAGTQEALHKSPDGGATWLLAIP